jgi:phenylacetaldehyde dehydrogenase
VQASVGNLKRVSLELGGKSPNIVLPDADLAKAAKSAASGIFSNQGQTCTAGSRLYVHEDVHDVFVGLLVQEARALKIGPGLDPTSDLGPVISEEQFERILSYIEIGQREGARLACGGGKPAHLNAGYFLEPTVFLGAQQSMRVVQEEIFGPVASVLIWRDLDDLIRKANDSVYGLGAGVWTNDLTNAHDLAHALKAGTVWVNCYNLVDAASPFGGYKESGWGREMGRYAMDLYSETKSIWINLSR